MAPVIAIIAVVALGGIGFAVYSNSNKKEAVENTETAPTVVDPFANVPKEDGPKGLSPGGKRTGIVERSPAGLLDDPTWVDLTSRANVAIALHNDAQKALKAGPEQDAVYRSKGLDAKDQLNTVLEDMFIWYADLVDKYGENDRRVRQISAEREKWFKVVGKYRGLRRG